MATFLVRVELPDRPGALGAVASRIGAVRGDVVAVEIVQRRHGAAVDEFVVELADESRLSLLLSEIGEVDGVSVEAVLPITGRGHDRRLDAYTTAMAILEARSPQDVLNSLAVRVCAELDAAWSALVDVEGALMVASHGRAPAAAWLAALVTETRAADAPAGAISDGEAAAATGRGAEGDGGEGHDAGSEGHGGQGYETGSEGQGGERQGGESAAPGPRREAGAELSRGGDRGASDTPPADAPLTAGSWPQAAPDRTRAGRREAADTVWVDLTAWDLVLAVGRPGWRFGTRERTHLSAVALLADARWVDLAERDGRTSQPGCTA